jgi:hypothetical protein
MRVGDGIGVFLFVFALSSIAQLLFVMLWKPGPQQIDAAWETTPQPPRQHPRIVWIVFDELSYDQLFEHRAHDLALPNFDALRARARSSPTCSPPAKTVKIIPSLLTGQRSTTSASASTTALGPLRRRARLASASTAADRLRRREQQGWRTAAVGWYNPYCTIYGDAIQNCYWTNLDRIDGLMAQRDPFWRNTYSPLQQVVREIKAPARADRDICTFDVRQRYQTHIDLQQHAFQLLHTDQADFVFLHCRHPAQPQHLEPHPRRLHPVLRQLLPRQPRARRPRARPSSPSCKASPRWKDTTLIVEGDHGWRIDAWDWLPAWTEEDDAASRGVFDPRPACSSTRPARPSLVQFGQ